MPWLRQDLLLCINQKNTKNGWTTSEVFNLLYLNIKILIIFKKIKISFNINKKLFYIYFILNKELGILNGFMPIVA